MKGDFHVRFCENVRVKLPCVTRLCAILTLRTSDIANTNSQPLMKAFKPVILYFALIAIAVLLKLNGGNGYGAILNLTSVVFAIFYLVKSIVALVKKQGAVLSLSYFFVALNVLMICTKIYFRFYNMYLHLIVIAISIILFWQLIKKSKNEELEANYSRIRPAYSIYFLLSFILLFVSDLWLFAKWDFEFILYSDEASLNWNHFNGAPETNDACNYSAGINCEIMYRLNYVHNYKVAVVGAFMNPNKSWRKAENPELLKHENYHFKIDEIFVRKIRNRISELNSNEKVGQIVDEEIKNRDEMQGSYDGETNHGLNLVVQQSWYKKIDDYLASSNQ